MAPEPSLCSFTHIQGAAGVRRGCIVCKEVSMSLLLLAACSGANLQLDGTSSFIGMNGAKLTTSCNAEPVQTWLSPHRFSNFTVSAGTVTVRLNNVQQCAVVASLDVPPASTRTPTSLHSDGVRGLQLAARRLPSALFLPGRFPFLPGRFHGPVTPVSACIIRLGTKGGVICVSVKGGV